MAPANLSPEVLRYFEEYGVDPSGMAIQTGRHPYSSFFMPPMNVIHPDRDTPEKQEPIRKFYDYKKIDPEIVDRYINEKNTPMLAIPGKASPAIAHELAHATGPMATSPAYNMLYSLGKPYKGTALQLGSYLGAHVAEAIGGSPTVPKAFRIAAAAIPLVMLAEETRANASALKTEYDQDGANGVLNALPFAAESQGSYMAAAAAPYLFDKAVRWAGQEGGVMERATDKMMAVLAKLGIPFPKL